MTAGAVQRAAVAATKGGDAGVSASKQPAKTATSTAPRGAPPQAPPPFSVSDLRKAIPAELFERNPVIGFAHLLRDLVMVAALFSLNYWLQHSTAVPFVVKALAWPVYWYATGAYLTGVWVIAHECGHQAFSPSRLLNDAVGLVLHSALLVPYHSWAISHSHHHLNTCSMENDEVFVPYTVHEYGLADSAADTPLANLWRIFLMLTVGWPAYLLANFTGPEKYRGQRNSHFDPVSALYSRKQAPLILLSDIGVLCAVAVLAWACTTFGALAVAAYYGVPYLVVNAHLVLITYLQHTDTYVPHYREAEFTWLRGALSTVDRSFGMWLDDAFHHIADSHVAHHLFHTMPFYNAVKATPYIKSVLKDYYLSDATPIATALYNSRSSCKYVDGKGDVLYYRSAQDFDRAAAEKNKAL